MAMLPGLSHWQPEDEGESLQDITLGGLLRSQAQSFGGRPAIIFDEPTMAVSWTYAELDAEVDRVARALIAIGTAAGDRVALMSPNRPEWVLLEYALARIGAVLVTVNPAFRSAELRYLLDQGRISTLICADMYRGFSFAGIVAELVPDLASCEAGQRKTHDPFPHLRNVIGLGDNPINGSQPFPQFLDRSTEIGDTEFAERCAAVKPNDISQIQYTSGTTGSPKGAMLTHYGTVNNAMLAARRAGYTQHDIMVSAMPFFHTAGCVCNVMGMAAAGGCLVAMENFDADRMLSLIEKYHGTITNAVPTMYVRLLQDEKLISGERNLSSWRIAYTGGTSIPPSLMLELHDRIGAEPTIIMGMTECSPIITQTIPTAPLTERVHNAGLPLPHVEIRIVDTDTGQTTPTGQTGELHIRGFLVTAGYFEMPERTAEAIDSDGWLHSGDLAVLDANGYLRIVGRIKDMLIRGGENIYPAEIEDHLLRHEMISQAQIVGVPNAEFGEEIFAFIVTRNGSEIDADALRQWCRQNMARHKLPRYIARVNDMPQTANGKIRKIELRDLATKMIAEGSVQ